VDDEPLVLDPMCECIEEMALFTCDPTHDAAVAHRRLHDGHYHACLSDLGLPGLDRDELALFRQHGDSLPMFAVSGKGKMGLALRCAHAGAVDVIDKCEFHGAERFYDLLLSILVYGVIGRGGAFREEKCRRALDALIAYRPREVRDWARALGKDERELRRMVSPCLLKAKYLHRLFLVLWQALDYHWRQARQSLPVSRLHRRSADEQRRAAEYYLTNRGVFEPLFSMTSAAA
jgi:CheY-like chemotaxis protein